MAAFPAPDLASPRFKASPHAFYARARAERPVFRTRWVFRFPMWVVTRYDDAKFVLKDERFSKDFRTVTDWLPRPIRSLTRNVLNLDPPDHTRLRALMSKAFTPRVVDNLRGRTERLCDELLEAGARRGSMELVSAFALPVPLTIIAELLGVPPQDRLQFAEWSKKVSSASAGAPLEALVGWAALWRFARYFRKLVALRRVEPRDDLITALVEAEEAGDRLSEDELIAMISILLFAGHETTVNLISSGALTLMQHPEQRDRLLADPALVEPAIEELLRYTSPGDMATPRVAREEIELGGTCIPRGALVVVALGSANRDASQFPEPDTLDLAREPNRHLAFGMGIHYCVGAPLARMEGQIALASLFRRFPRLRLAQAPESLRWRKGLFFRGPEALPVDCS